MFGAMGIRAKLIALTAIGLLSAALIAGGGIWVIKSSFVEELRLGTRAMRHQMEADMMHDALRADVLNGLRVGGLHDPAQEQTVKEELAEHIARFKENIDQLRAIDYGSDVHAAVVNVGAPLDAYVKAADQIANLALTDPNAATIKLPEFLKTFGVLEDEMSNISDVIGKRVEGIENEARQFNKTSLNLILGMLMAGAVIQLFFSTRLTRGIVNPLKSSVDVAQAISSGRLNNHIRVDSKDEVGALMTALQQMQEKLIEVIAGIRDGSRDVTDISGQVAMGTGDLSNRIQDQAASLAEMASSMDEMSSSVNQNTDSARQASQLAIAAREHANKGGDVAGQAMSAMTEISQASRRIAEIIGVIDEIAFQTNLLALNAAVEAARAGEQGRGFAVVASEVRNLAGRSATAAKEIKALIQDSVQKVDEGYRLVNQTGTTLQEIVASVKKVSDIVAEIAAATKEQAHGVSQANQAVAQMDGATQQNAALVEEAAAAAATLGDQAQGLDTLVSYFSIGETHEATPLSRPALSQPHRPALPRPTGR